MIRATVSALSISGRLKARDTLERLTPTAAATWLIVTDPLGDLAMIADLPRQGVAQPTCTVGRRSPRPAFSSGQQVSRLLDMQPVAWKRCGIGGPSVVRNYWNSWSH
jgi:hypothetical protein